MPLCRPHFVEEPFERERTRCGQPGGLLTVPLQRNPRRRQSYTTASARCLTTSCALRGGHVRLPHQVVQIPPSSGQRRAATELPSTHAFVSAPLCGRAFQERAHMLWPTWGPPDRALATEPQTSAVVHDGPCQMLDGFVGFAWGPREITAPRASDITLFWPKASSHRVALTTCLCVGPSLWKSLARESAHAVANVGAS